MYSHRLENTEKSINGIKYNLKQLENNLNQFDKSSNPSGAYDNPYFKKNNEFMTIRDIHKPDRTYQNLDY